MSETMQVARSVDRLAGPMVAVWEKTMAARSAVSTGPSTAAKRAAETVAMRAASRDVRSVDRLAVNLADLRAASWGSRRAAKLADSKAGCLVAG